MRMLRFTSASTAFLLLLLGASHTTRTSPASSSDHANNHTSEQNDLTFAAAGITNIGTGLPVGTAATPRPFRGETDALGIGDATGAAQDIHLATTELPYLGPVDVATRSASSGIDTTTTTVDTSTDSTSHEVSSELKIGFDKEAEDGDGGFGWTQFERESATPRNQFMARFWNALLYVCHIITAHHVRTLLFGRRSRRFGRYHYRLANPNSKKNRRRRRVSRLTAYTNRTLSDAWSQLIWNMLAFVGGGRKESASMRELRLNGDLALAPRLPAQAVPVTGYPQMADLSAGLPPASSLAVLTPLGTPEAPWPPLNLSPPAGSARVGDAIIPLEPVAAAQMLDLPVATLLEPPPPAAPWWGPVAAQILELLVTLWGLLVAQLLELLLDLLQKQLPSAGAPLLLEQRGAVAAAPLLFGPPPAPVAAAAGGGAPLLLGPPAAAPLMILPAELPLEQAPAPLLVGPPAAALLRILPAAPQLERPAAPLQILPAAAPLVAPPAALLMILPAAPLLLEPPPPAVFGGAILPGPAVAPRLIMPALPRLAIPAAPRLEPPVAPIHPALPAAPLPHAPDAAVAVPLDAVNWSGVAKTFAVMDLHESDSMETPKRGWRGVINAAVDSLAIACSASENVAVRWVLTEATELFPCTGYIPGSEHAALAIYRGVRADKEVALGVFVKWASPPAWFQRSTVNGHPLQLEKGLGHSWKVLREQSPAAHTWLGDETMTALYADLFLSAVTSLCTRQGLPGHVVHDLIQKTLEAGNNGPAVSLWVMHSLLDVAEADCKRNMDATPDLCIRSRLVSAGQTITTFEDLSRHALMTLSSFVDGYEAAVFGRGR